MSKVETTPDFIGFGEPEIPEGESQGEPSSAPTPDATPIKREPGQSPGGSNGKRKAEDDPPSACLLEAAQRTAPWLGHSGSMYSLPRRGAMLTDLLTREIHDFAAYISPTKEEMAMRDFVIRRVALTVLHVFGKDARVQVFGSYSTKLFLPTSDLDLVVQVPSVTTSSALHRLADALAKGNVCDKRGIQRIPTATVPIIKLREAVTRYSLDISFNSESGVVAAERVDALMRDPHVGGALRPLMYVLKQYLFQLHLNEPYTGGLGSYGILLMLLHFLRRHPLLSLSSPRAIDTHRNLGVLLLEFFEFYGQIHNLETVAISFERSENKATYTSRAAFQQRNGSTEKVQYNRRQSPITVVDPHDATNNVTRSSFNYMAVRRAFVRAYSLLTYVQANYYARLTDHQQQRHGSRPLLPVSQLGIVLSIEPSDLRQRLHIRRELHRLETGQLNVSLAGKRQTPVPRPAGADDLNDDDDDSELDAIDDYGRNAAPRGPYAPPPKPAPRRSYHREWYDREENFWGFRRGQYSDSDFDSDYDSEYSY